MIAQLLVVTSKVNLIEYVNTRVILHSLLGHVGHTACLTRLETDVEVCNACSWNARESTESTWLCVFQSTKGLVESVESSCTQFYAYSTMAIKVAIAGGTAPQLGRAIVTGIQDYPDQLQAIVLTRPSSEIPPWLENLNVEIRRVDYMSEPSLVEALEDVHTVGAYSRHS